MLIVPQFQAQVALAAGPVSNWTQQKFGGFSTAGLRGQFAVGLLLGAVWSPCVGPTLGAASVLAAQGENLGAVDAHHAGVRPRRRAAARAARPRLP